MTKKRSSDFWSRIKCTPTPEKILATPMTLSDLETVSTYQCDEHNHHTIQKRSHEAQLLQTESVLSRSRSFKVNAPFSSDRQHLSYDGCLEVRGEIIRTVLCCIVYWKLCTVISTLRWAVLTVLWIGFCFTGPISLCVDSCVYVFFCVVLSYCICVVLL